MVQATKIITVDAPQQHFLKMKTEEIQKDEYSLAQEIANQLYVALEPHFPSAGLAAPQIGINKSIFIYSYDRDPSHLEAIINPQFTPVNNNKVEGWEACLSVILSDTVWTVAKLARYESIKAVYSNLNGEKVEKVLEGFAAKAFQHEYDHLQGIVNIYRDDAITQSFASLDELKTFMQAVKKQDAAHYKAPSR